jgi:hypothetical protein
MQNIKKHLSNAGLTRQLTQPFSYISVKKVTQGYHYVIYAYHVGYHNEQSCEVLTHSLQ